MGCSRLYYCSPQDWCWTLGSGSGREASDSRRRLVAQSYGRGIKGLKVVGKANCRFIVREGADEVKII